MALPSVQAAREMLAQLAAIDGPVRIADLQRVDGLGPPPWTSFLPGRDPATVGAWVEIARRTSRYQAAGRQIPGVMPIYEEAEPVNTSGENEDPAGGEFIAGLGSGANDEFDTRLFGSLVAQSPQPTCPSVEDDGAIGLATPTLIGAFSDLDLCGGYIGDGPHGTTTGDSDFFALNYVEEGETMVIDVGTFDPSVGVPEVVTAIYNSEGVQIATGIDGGADFASTRLEATAPATDLYYASVTGCCANQADPFDETSGEGPTTEGEYLAFVGTPGGEPVAPCEATEPNDSIATATIAPFNGPLSECQGQIGDGEYGETSGDYDFYALPELPADSPLIIDIINGIEGDASVVVTLYDSEGTLVQTFVDENDVDFTEVVLPETDSYFVGIGGCCEPTSDPAVPGSGPGPDIDGNFETGPYDVVFFSPALIPLADGAEPIPIPGPGALQRMARLFQKLQPSPPTVDLWADGSSYLAAAFQVEDDQERCRSLEDDGSRSASNPVPYGPAGRVICVGAIGDAQQETGDFDLFDLGEFAVDDIGDIVVAANEPPPEPPVIDGPIMVLPIDELPPVQELPPIEAPPEEPPPVEAPPEEGPIEEGPIDELPPLGDIGLAQDAPAGFQPTIDIIGPDGTVIASGEPFQPGVTGVFFNAVSDGRYWARIGGQGSNQIDPDAADSGDGPGSVGAYLAGFFRSGLGGQEPADVDTYLVDLEEGDVLRVGLAGAFSTSILRPDGSNAQQSFFSPSFAYPRSSPLRHLGSTGVEHVAEVTGRHAISVTGGGGPYEAELRVVRAGLTYSEGSDTQILWLDFDGADIDPSDFDPFQSSQTVSLSPLVDFLPGWGLDASDEDAVIDAIVAAVEEDFNEDLPITGGNGDRDVSGFGGEFDVEIRNSRDDGDLTGQPNVTRLIIGGTIEESGIPTVGIAQSIDPGNFDTEESGLVLLDLLSAEVDPEAPDLPTLNQYEIAPGASKIDLIGRGVGVITSHEAGHMLGGFHTDTFNDVPNIMDSGGNLDNTIGVGPDRIWGTADDVDVDHVTDVYSPDEGFTGTENLAVRMARALSTGRTDVNVGGGQLEPGIYRISNFVYDSYLHADGLDNVDTAAFADPLTQWELIADGDSWLIRNTLNGYYLDADFADEDFNVELSQVPAADDRWTIILDGDASFLIRNDESRRYVSANGGDGVNVDQSASPDNANATLWAFERVEGEQGAFVGSTVSLRNVSNNRWLDADDGDEGFNADTSATESIETLWAVGDAGNGDVYLRNVGTNRFLDTDANGDVDTSETASSDDRWAIIDLGNGIYNLRSVDRNTFLDADGEDQGFDVNQSTSAAFDDQWVITIAELGG